MPRRCRPPAAGQRDQTRAGAPLPVVSTVPQPRPIPCRNLAWLPYRRRRITGGVTYRGPDGLAPWWPNLNHTFAICGWLVAGAVAAMDSVAAPERVLSPHIA